jgi:hypothetical protein
VTLMPFEGWTYNHSYATHKSIMITLKKDIDKGKAPASCFTYRRNAVQSLDVGPDNILAR